MSAIYMGDVGLGLRYVNGKFDLADNMGTVDVFVSDNVKAVVSDCEATDGYLHSMSGEIIPPFKGYTDDGFFNIKCD